MSKLSDDVHAVRIEIEALLDRLKASGGNLSPSGGDAGTGSHLSDDRKKKINRDFDPLAVWRVVNNPGKFS